MLNDTRGELQQTFRGAAGLDISTQAINPCASACLWIWELWVNTHARVQSKTMWMNNEFRSVKNDKPYFDFTDNQEKIHFPLHKEMSTHDNITLKIVCYQCLGLGLHEQYGPECFYYTKRLLFPVIYHWYKCCNYSLCYITNHQRNHATNYVFLAKCNYFEREQ